jgi:hypothetical protein
MTNENRKDEQVDDATSERSTKLVELPKTLGVTTPRDSPNQSPGVTILDRTTINIKNDVTSRISRLSSGKQIHGKTGT